MRRSVVVATVIAGVGMTLLVRWMNQPSVIYSMDVSELASRGLWDRQVRLHGMLVGGTLCKTDAECGYRFRIADVRSHEQLQVNYPACVVPDTFRDLPGIDLNVTIEGERCRSCHVFEASRIMAKCPAKYQFPRSDGGLMASALPMPRCSALTPRM
jgi:cytochrome c-type biogenesis protein CcmE